jgi:NADPH-dependent glutamate synthase beta subunit-like oxidoreductase
MAHPSSETEQSRHVVVVVGGAVAGSEAAAVCAERGAHVIVLEQGKRPFGKIEDGLPRWHEKLRLKEYEAIAKNLSHPGISFVPCTALGRDVQLDDIVHRWGVSAVLLGSGAWRDRPLFEGADAYLGRGLVPQNTFVHWYNHYPEPGYRGPTYSVPDRALVVGGGLASIDVAKIINLELYQRALAAQGHKLSTVELEHEGIAPVLQRLGIPRASLGVHGATLFYRREKEAMPIASAPDDATAEQRAKVAQVRAKLMDKVIERFLVHFAPNHALKAPLLDDGRLCGLVFEQTRTVDGKLVTLPNSEQTYRADLVVSSIGSIPQPIAGVPMRGELIDFADHNTGRVRGFDAVFGLGNALTGKGNIKDSRRNALQISTHVAEAYLGLTDAVEGTSPAHAHAHAHEQALRAAEIVKTRPIVAPAQQRELNAIVRSLQARVGFDGNLTAWLAQSPVRVQEAAHEA